MAAQRALANGAVLGAFCGAHSGSAMETLTLTPPIARVKRQELASIGEERLAAAAVVHSNCPLTPSFGEYAAVLALFALLKLVVFAAVGPVPLLGSNTT